MDTDFAYLHRGYLKIPTHAGIQLRRLGKGHFCTAYTDGKDAILYVPDGCYDKALLADVYRRHSDNPHLPAVTYLDATKDGHLYTSPVYGKLRKTTAPVAWASWQSLRKAYHAAILEWDAAVAASPREHRLSLLWNGYVYNDIIAKHVKLHCETSLVEAIDRLRDVAADYSESVIFEFRPGNLGVGAAGQLILLDPTFDVELRNRMWDAAERKRRGY